MASVIAKCVQYVPLKIICQDRSYLYFRGFFSITYLFFNDWYIFGPQLTARKKKTEKIFPFPLIFPFQVHFFYP